MTVQKRAKPRSEQESKQRLRLWVRLLRASRTVEIEIRERLRTTFATTLPKFDVMAALDRCPAGMTMTELSRFLMVSNGNVTGIIDRLVAEGFVVRLAHDGDRRTTCVRLTSAGAEQFLTIAKAHEAWVAELLAGFTEGEIQTLIDLLSTLSPPANIGAQRK